MSVAASLHIAVVRSSAMLLNELLLLLTFLLSQVWQASCQDPNRFNITVVEKTRNTLVVHSNYRNACDRVVKVRDMVLDLDFDQSLEETQEVDIRLLSTLLSFTDILSKVLEQQESEKKALKEDLFNEMLKVPRTLLLLEKVFLKKNPASVRSLISEARIHLQKAFAMVQVIVDLSDQLGPMQHGIRLNNDFPYIVDSQYFHVLPGPVYPTYITYF